MDRRQARSAFAALSQDTRLSIVRLLEIVGEAAARATPEIRADLPDLPWAEIVGLRRSLPSESFTATTGSTSTSSGRSS